MMRKLLSFVLFVCCTNAFVPWTQSVFHGKTPEELVKSREDRDGNKRTQLSDLMRGITKRDGEKYRQQLSYLMRGITKRNNSKSQDSSMMRFMRKRYNQDTWINGKRRQSQKGVNFAPKPNDDNSVPKSYRLQEKWKEHEWNEKHRKRLHQIIKKKTGNSKVIEGFERRDYESDWQFWNRVCRETDAFVQEKKLKIKFEVDGTTEEEIKDEKHWKKSKNDDLSNKERRLLEGDANVKQEGSKVKKRKKSQKLRKTDDSIAESLDVRELIPFGERVDAPPEFTGAVAKTLKLAKPVGKRDLLFLKSEPSTKQSSPKVTQSERQRVIDQYRLVKKNRRLLANTRID